MNHQWLEAFKTFIAENLILIVVVIIYYLFFQKLKLNLFLCLLSGHFKINNDTNPFMDWFSPKKNKGRGVSPPLITDGIRFCFAQNSVFAPKHCFNAYFLTNKITERGVPTPAPPPPPPPFKDEFRESGFWSLPKLLIENPFWDSHFIQFVRLSVAQTLTIVEVQSFLLNIWNSLLLSDLLQVCLFYSWIVKKKIQKVVHNRCARYNTFTKSISQNISKYLKLSQNILK